MKKFMTIIFPIIIGLISIFPFIFLEFLTTQNIKEKFPFMLFGLLLILPIAITMLFVPITRHIGMANKLLLLLRVALLMALGIIWLGIVEDQFHCFLRILYCG
jgi:hypothetical protein